MQPHMLKNKQFFTLVREKQQWLYMVPDNSFHFWPEQKIFDRTVHTVIFFSDIFSSFFTQSVP